MGVSILLYQARSNSEGRGNNVSRTGMRRRHHSMAQELKIGTRAPTSRTCGSRLGGVANCGFCGTDSIRQHIEHFRRRRGLQNALPLFAVVQDLADL